MSNPKESAAARIERLKREKEAAKQSTTEKSDIVGQLTHESDGKPDYEELARRLEERKAMEVKDGIRETVKMTIYVDKALATAFNALCLKHGDQKRYINEAIADFVARKARELELE